MISASAVTNELGRYLNTTFTVGWSGHGGSSKSCYSDFKQKMYKGEFPIERLHGVSSVSPSALTELLKTGVSKNTIVTHHIAYHKKVNKKGKEYDSHLGQYISFKFGGFKFSALIKGYSCLFFVNDKRVTNITKGNL